MSKTCPSVGLLVLAGWLSAACGGGERATASDAAARDGEAERDAEAALDAQTTGDAAVDTDASSDSDAGAGEPSCAPFGAFPAPTRVFTLPLGKESIAYPDVQAAFPNVDWTTLERLYIPAGKYKTLQLGNLPVRTAEAPLVITNSGGQVQVGPNLGGNYIWAMGGGANWILTGRYDADAQTGHADFAGHRCGAYADSRGKYGFLSDDAFDHSGAYTHMGLAVGSGATDFEIEFVEVTRSGFAGIRLLNALPSGASDPDKPMRNVRIHDNYVHDVEAEGFYFGWTGAPPSYQFENLQIYNNRVVRTGSEALQVQDLGEGTRIHHNVFAFGALHWLDAFGRYQDGLLQILVREGNIEFDHNISLGGAGTFLSFFSSPQAGEGARNVTFHDNYFADSRSLGGYLNGSSSAPSSFTFRDNVFRGLDFSYDALDPAETDPGVVFGVNAGHKAPILFEDNTIEDSKLLAGIDLNGTRTNITASGNRSAAVAPVRFANSGYPEVPTSKLTQWGATATLAPGMPAIRYAVGDLVMHDAQLYRALKASEGLVPSEHADAWEKLPLPADDLRVQSDSPHAALGIR